MNKVIINIGGEDRMFRLGLGLMGEIIDATGLGLEDVVRNISSNPYKYVPLFMYHSLKFTDQCKGIVSKLTLENVIDWIDELEDSYNSQEVLDFMKALNSSFTKDVPEMEAGSVTNELESSDDKKKVIGQKM